MEYRLIRVTPIDTPADKQLKPYVQGRYAVRNAQFSPDGKFVAYASNESGGWKCTELIA